MFKVRKGLNISYQKQGYIYFKSHNYNKLSDAERSEIDKLCRKAGGEYAEAVKVYMTTETSATTVSIDYYLSKATLYRAVDRYYKLFAEKI